MKGALDILEETGTLESKPCSIPLMSNTKLFFESVDKLQNPNPYTRHIGKLLYLTNTRPDITFDVQLLSQFVQEPTTHHQHVLLYINAQIVQIKVTHLYK